MEHLEKYRNDLSYELLLNKEMKLDEIKQRLDTLIQLAKNAGKMELNAKHPDFKIDTINPFMH